MKRYLPFAIIVVVLLLASAAVWYFARNAPKASSIVSSNRSPASTIDPQLGAEPPHALGSLNAPVMIEEFGDFQCRACGALHPMLTSAKARFGVQLVIVFREFPLTSAHKNADAAARAAEAAGLQGKFWEMHDLLFEKQSDWSDVSEVGPIFEQFAATIGLDVERYRRDLLSDMVRRRIEMDVERGKWIGVTGTPTVFLNGHEVQQELASGDLLMQAIAAELRH